MKTYSEETKNELLKNIKTDTFETKDLSKMLSKRIVGVRLVTGRGKMTISASNKALGISVKTSTEAEDFKKKNIRSGAFLLFDDATIRAFDNLFANARQALQRYAISKEGNIYYLTSENYETFEELFNSKYLVAFNEEKEKLIGSLDTAKDSFKKALTSWLTEVIDDDKERTTLINYYVSKFPTKSMMEKDCNLSLMLSAFPIVTEDSLVGIDKTLAAKIAESNESSTIETLASMVSKNLAEAYKITEKMINTIDIETSFDETRLLNLNMGSRTKGLLNQTIDYLKNNNFVLKNDTIGTIIFILERTFIKKQNVYGKDITNAEALAVSESLLAGIYGYATKNELDEELEEVMKTSDYDAESLDIIADDIDLEKL